MNLSFPRHLQGFLSASAVNSSQISGLREWVQQHCWCSWASQCLLVKVFCWESAELCEQELGLLHCRSYAADLLTKNTFSYLSTGSVFIINKTVLQEKVQILFLLPCPSVVFFSLPLQLLTSHPSALLALPNLSQCFCSKHLPWSPVQGRRDEGCEKQSGRQDGAGHLAQSMGSGTEREGGQRPKTNTHLGTGTKQLQSKI